MEKKHYELSTKFTELNSQVKDAVCGWMKELGHIKFNTRRDFPFVDTEGEFKSVVVEELKYNEDYDTPALKAHSFRGGMKTQTDASR